MIKYHANTVASIRDQFDRLYEDRQITVDGHGNDVVEIIGASFIADEDVIFGEINEDYVRRELKWYKSQSTNINDIDGTPPTAWQSSANKHGEINSNYGLLAYGYKYGDQMGHAIDELITNPHSRRATVIYTRPSIWHDYCENGKSDFICTNAVSYYIRNNTLHAVVQMRSNDAVFGYKNDLAWQQECMHTIIETLDDGTEFGTITWQVQNLHVYSRHFHLIKP